MPATTTSDAIVIGGGVIGLSIAYELAARGVSAVLLERGEVGREASWAGAGVLPPASWYVDHPALDLAALAAAPMHAELSERLREETGVDDQYDRCGAEHQLTAENCAHVRRVLGRWRGLGVAAEQTGETRWSVPGEAQVRNPRRVRGLAEACRRRGVRVVTGAEVVGFRESAGCVEAVESTAGEHSAGAVVLAAGCWTPALGASLGAEAPGRPVRGQMLLLRPARPTIGRIVHRHPYYAVPRRDGRVLVGATVEEAGFDKANTPAGVEELLVAAASIDPALADAPVEAAWAGLRPASGDALPIVGALPELENVWIASGHHRSGLQLAPPTARAIASMIAGAKVPTFWEAFAPARFADAPAARARLAV